MLSVDPDSLNFLVIDMARLIRAEFERRVAEAGIGVTPAEARLLAHLVHCGPMRQHLLAERLSVTQMSVCGFIDKLEASGLVRREPDPNDRRAKQVHLTAAAQPILAQIGDIGMSLRAIARGDMDEAEWLAFAASAARARNNLLRAREAGRTSSR